MPKPLIRLELAMHLEDLRTYSEAEYAVLLLHNLWELECLARRAGYQTCANALGAGRFELMQILPDFQATHPEPRQASAAVPEYGGVEQLAACRPHKPKVEGSSPSPATAERPMSTSTVKTAHRVPDRCAVATPLLRQTQKIANVDFLS